MNKDRSENNAQGGVPAAEDGSESNLSVVNRIREFFASRAHSFRHAFRGWWYVFRTQRNAWIHAAISILVLLAAFWLKLPLRDWAVLFLTIALVWSAEFINTAIEAVVDLASPDQHPLARVGKDVGAAAVLLAALFAILVGLAILGPPLFLKLKALFGR